MKLAIETIPLELLRTDGGTSARDKADRRRASRIRDLMDAYKDANADIKALDAVRDMEGNFWLIDGFMRLEALQRLGADSAAVNVLCGSLERARLLAARCNLHGLEYRESDKKRAVLMADAAARALGEAMSGRALAKHCGVSHTYVQIIFGSKVASTCHALEKHHPTSAEKAPDLETSRGVLRARIETVLREDVGRTDKAIAKEVGCQDRTVRKMRDHLGLPPSDRSRRRDKDPANVVVEITDERRVLTMLQAMGEVRRDVVIAMILTRWPRETVVAEVM